jgi:hypothetical protein
MPRWQLSSLPLVKVCFLPFHNHLDGSELIGSEMPRIPALLFRLKEGIFSPQKSFSIASTAKGELKWQMTLLI